MIINICFAVVVALLSYQDDNFVLGSVAVLMIILQLASTSHLHRQIRAAKLSEAQRDAMRREKLFF